MHEEGFFADPRSWVAIAFLIFFLLLGKRIVSGLNGLLDKRAEGVRTELAEAARLRREAEAMLADARKRREQALAQAEAMLKGAQAEADRLAKSAAADAEHSAKRREQMAMDRIAAAERSAIDDVRFAAVDIATTAAARVLRDDVSPDTDTALVDRAIQGLPAALASRRAA